MLLLAIISLNLKSDITFLKSTCFNVEALLVICTCKLLLSMALFVLLSTNNTCKKFWIMKRKRRSGFRRIFTIAFDRLIWFSSIFMIDKKRRKAPVKIQQNQLLRFLSTIRNFNTWICQFKYGGQRNDYLCILDFNKTFTIN